MSIVFQILNILTNYLDAWSKQKKNIILFRIFSSCFNAMAILTAGNFIGSLPVFFTIVRNIICFFKDKFKSNTPIWLITTGYCIIAKYTISNMESFTDVLPVIISLVTALVIWYGNSSHIKICSSIGSFVWIVYYLSSGLYLTACYNIVQITLELITLVRIKLGKLKEKEKVI